jgi:hypothetical protein
VALKIQPKCARTVEALARLISLLIYGMYHSHDDILPLLFFFFLAFLFSIFSAQAQAQGSGETESTVKPKLRCQVGRGLVWILPWDVTSGI